MFTVELSTEQWKLLQEACSQAEAMFRHRANNSVCNRGDYSEEQCRAEMARYRDMNKYLVTNATQI